MFCPNCGNEIKELFMFCGNCGTKIDGYSDEVSSFAEENKVPTFDEVKPPDITADAPVYNAPETDATYTIADSSPAFSEPKTIPSDTYVDFADEKTARFESGTAFSANLDYDKTVNYENQILNSNPGKTSKKKEKNSSKGLIIVIIILAVIVVAALATAVMIFMSGGSDSDTSADSSVSDTKNDSSENQDSSISGDNVGSGNSGTHNNPNGGSDSGADGSVDENSGYDKFSGVKVGDTVKFGKFEQDNYVSNGKENIEWIVLDKADGKILVISKYALDCQLYNESDQNVTWETSTIRTWLNDTFYNGSFSDEEKKYIPTMDVIAEDNSEYNTDAGKDTKDKVFLLSVSEAERYFSSDADRMCAPTTYARIRGTFVNKETNTTWWWLRTPGYDQTSAVDVFSTGSVYKGGCTVTGNDGAVRPAMWINVK